MACCERLRCCTSTSRARRRSSADLLSRRSCCASSSSSRRRWRQPSPQSPTPFVLFDLRRRAQNPLFKRGLPDGASIPGERLDKKIIIINRVGLLKQTLGRLNNSTWKRFIWVGAVVGIGTRRCTHTVSRETYKPRIDHYYSPTGRPSWHLNQCAVIFHFSSDSGPGQVSLVSLGEQAL